MKCPECKTIRLTPMKLEHELPAKGCHVCHGALLDLVTYRMWAERDGPDAKEASPVEAEPEVDRKAILCPGCQRIMLRFRYTSDTNHVLDVCSSCDQAWLQPNEWDYLKTRSIHGELTQIFTDPWQRERRVQVAKRTFEKEWDTRLGGALHAELREFRTRVRALPEYSQVMAYLASDDPYQA